MNCNMDKIEFLIHLRHLAEYSLTIQAIKSWKENVEILEIGCGVGYGTQFISDTSTLTVGLDVSKEAFREIKNHNNIYWVLGNGILLPFRNESFDVVISLQMIEHIEKKNLVANLNEIKRVLRNKGCFVLTTPNRALRLLPFQKPWNPFHKHEYNAKELKKILQKIFSHSYVKGIGATKDLREIEKKRVKQSVFSAYIKQPLGRIRLSILPLPSRGKDERLLWKAFEETSKRYPKYSVGNYFLEEVQRDSLDLFGVGVKA
ncbi:MAG: class I SAM-dependent methyltransferase [Promethearchaeota archaeon]